MQKVDQLDESIDSLEIKYKERELLAENFRKLNGSMFSKALKKE